MPSEQEIELAEKIIKHVPCAEMVRFTNDGTEACEYAVRLARAHTGKQKVVKIEGLYHGTLDLNFSVKPSLELAGPPHGPTPVPESGGLLQCIAENTIVIPFNDEEVLERTLESRHEEIACIILSAFDRLGPLRSSFLSKLRKLTSAYGVILILDEVVTGFRVALGGSSRSIRDKARHCSPREDNRGRFPNRSVCR